MSVDTGTLVVDKSIKKIPIKWPASGRPKKEMAAEDTGPERGRKEMPSRAAKRAKTTAASPAASASKSPKGRGRGKGKALRGKRRPAGRTARVVVSRTQ